MACARFIRSKRRLQEKTLEWRQPEGGRPCVVLVRSACVGRGGQGVCIVVAHQERGIGRAVLGGLPWQVSLGHTRVFNRPRTVNRNLSRF